MYKLKNDMLSGSSSTKSSRLRRKSSTDWSSQGTHSYDDFLSENLLDETVSSRPVISRKKLSGQAQTNDPPSRGGYGPSPPAYQEPSSKPLNKIVSGREKIFDQSAIDYLRNKSPSDRPPATSKPLFDYHGPKAPSNAAWVDDEQIYDAARSNINAEREPSPPSPISDIPQTRIPSSPPPTDQSSYYAPRTQKQLPEPPSLVIKTTRPFGRKPASSSQHSSDNDKLRLVIAIDYGTTYTGIAFAATQSNVAKLQDIEVLQSWGGITSSHKVPSVITYSEAPNGEKQWGMSISLDAITFVCTKMELERSEKKIDELELTLQVLEGTGKLDFENVKSSGAFPDYTWKTPTQIVTDYLTKVCDSFKEYIRPRYPPGMKIPVDIVITVPVGWSYQATESTFRAIRDAGFNEDSFPTLDHMIVVAEPEAASHFTARHLQEKGTKFLRENEHFVLCDAGGGTVDVVAYQVKRLEPHLELTRVSKPTSDKCGASWIDVGFKRWLRKVIGPEYYSALDPNNAGQKIGSHSTETGPMRKLMKEFEGKKKGFSNTTVQILLDLPEPLDNLQIEGRVNEGQLVIYPEEMKAIFNHYVSKVITLIKDQRQQVERKNRQVKNVFLVGGFGESPYLQEELQKSLKIKSIAMRKPEKNASWTAVVQGAVVYGIEKSRHKNVRFMKMSKRSYGIVVNEAFSVYQYNPRDCYTDVLTNKTMARKQFAWMIRRGDLILSDERKVAEKEFSFTFRTNDSRRFELPIYTFPYDDDDVPERWETGMHDVDKVGVVPCDLSSFSPDEFEMRLNQRTNEGHYIVYLVCKMQLSLASLEVDVFVNETSIGHVDLPLGAERPRRNSRDSDNSMEFLNG